MTVAVTVPNLLSQESGAFAIDNIRGDLPGEDARVSSQGARSPRDLARFRIDRCGARACIVSAGRITRAVSERPVIVWAVLVLAVRSPNAGRNGTPDQLRLLIGRLYKGESREMRERIRLLTNVTRSRTLQRPSPPRPARAKRRFAARVLTLPPSTPRNPRLPPP